MTAPLADRLTRLGEVLVALAGSPLATHVFQTLADQAGAALPADYMAICLADPEDDAGYRLHALSGGPPPPPRTLERREGIAGRAMRSGRVVVVDDVAGDPDATADVEGALAATGIRTALAAPLRRGVQVLGALLFARRPGAGYTEDDVHVASLLAAGVSGALETSRLYQALADERSTLGAVLGSTDDAVVMVSEDGLVVLANPAARAMLGLVPETVTGRPCAEALAGSPLLPVFEYGRPGTSELSLPDGRVAQVSLVSVATPYGEPVGLAAILRDITVLKQLEQMKNDFVAAVSHDLKNPISVITMTADMMRAAAAANARLLAWCDRIRDTAHGMTALVNDLLDLGKIEAGLDAPGESVDLVPLLRDAAHSMAPQAEAKGIALGVQAPPHVAVTAAPARLRQALVNLVGNAVKYTPADGRVSVEASVTAGEAARVRVSVADSGIGIPVRDLPHIFDKFYRVKSAATRDIPGTGLGLAITKSIIDAHGGRIWAESVEGAGTTFVFELPLDPDACPPRPTQHRVA